MSPPKAKLPPVIKRGLKRKQQRKPRNGTGTVDPPAVSEWGSTAKAWSLSDLIDESDVSREIVSVWRQNVYAAENGGEVQKMEDLYDRLDREREKWNERLNNPLTWGWGGEPDELNDWGGPSTNNAANKPHHWAERVQSDGTDGPPSARNHEQIPPPLLELLSSRADTLRADGRQRSYEFAQLSSEAKAEKIREIAYQLIGVHNH